jgi:hypothetical protein
MTASHPKTEVEANPERSCASDTHTLYLQHNVGIMSRPLSQT